MSFPLLAGRPALRLARIIGAALLALALSGCSAIRLGYANLPELSYWWLDGYVDFDDSQAPQVRTALAKIHAWHRTEELPKLVTLLQRAQREAAADLTPAQACSWEPLIRERFAALRGQIEAPLAQQAAVLAPAQIDHLARKFEQKNRAWRKDWLDLTPAQLQDKRITEITSRAEMLYGTLDERQRAVLRQELANSPYNPAVVLAERQRRQQDVLSVLRKVAGTGLPPAQAREQVAGLLERWLASPDPAYRAWLDSMRQETCRLTASLHNASSPAQRERAMRRLAAWQRDFSELATGS